MKAIDPGHRGATDSGMELEPVKVAPEVTAAEAAAIVDSWGAADKPGSGNIFGLHQVARALRAEVARLEREVERLEAELLDEMVNSNRDDF